MAEDGLQPTVAVLQVWYAVKLQGPYLRSRALNVLLCVAGVLRRD